MPIHLSWLPYFLGSFAHKYPLPYRILLPLKHISLNTMSSFPDCTQKQLCSKQRSPSLSEVESRLLQKRRLKSRKSSEKLLFLTFLLVQKYFQCQCYADKRLTTSSLKKKKIPDLQCLHIFSGQYFHHHQFQTTFLTSLNLEFGRDSHNWLLGVSMSQL